MADANVEVPVEDAEPGMGEKAKDHFDKENQNAVAAQVASASTDTSLITQWMAQSVFSAINLGSHVGAFSQRVDCVPTDIGEECVAYSPTRADKWTTTVESVSLAVALIVTLAHYCCMKQATKYVMGKMSEGILSMVVLGFVAAGMPAIMNPGNEQAIAEDGSILNANLYFFSWAGLAVAVYIFCTWLFHTCFKKRNLTAGVPKNKWYLLLAASVIVTSSAARILSENCSTGDSSLCNRTKYGIAAGSMAMVVALVVAVLSFTNHLSLYTEAGTSLLLFVIFIFAIAFLTFGGESAPASNVGNLYFSVWICFLLTMFLWGKCLKEVKKKRKGGDEQQADENVQDEETPAVDEKQEEATPEQPAASESNKASAADVAASF